jgi:hypothetical protein
VLAQLGELGITLSLDDSGTAREEQRNEKRAS